MDRHVQFSVQQQPLDLINEHSQAHALQGSFGVDVPLSSDGDDLEFPLWIYLTEPAEYLVGLN